MSPDTEKKIFKVAMNAASGGAASTFFNFFMGRCTFAAICFSVVGCYGWLHGKDLTSFAMFVTAIQGLLVLHSWKSDIHDERGARLEIEKLGKGNADGIGTAGQNKVETQRERSPMETRSSC